MARTGGFGKAFKFMDQDRTGFIEKAEFRQAINFMNLDSHIRKPVIDALLALIDTDDDRNDGGGTGGGTDIQYREFAKYMSSEKLEDVTAPGQIEGALAQVSRRAPTEDSTKDGSTLRSPPARTSRCAAWTRARNRLCVTSPHSYTRELVALWWRAGQRGDPRGRLACRRAARTGGGGTHEGGRGAVRAPPQASQGLATTARQGARRAQHGAVRAARGVRLASFPPSAARRVQRRVASAQAVCRGARPLPPPPLPWTRGLWGGAHCLSEPHCRCMRRWRLTLAGALASADAMSLVARLERPLVGWRIGRTRAAVVAAVAGATDEDR